MAECVAPSRGFAAAAEKLLNILGYDSDRKDDLSGDVAEFMREYPAADTESARQFRDAADRVNIVFQFAESEISQGELGERIEFNKGIATSFLFVAADLKKGRYSRSDYARFVREINKRFSAPTVALFRRPESKNKAVLTLAFVGRRQSQTQHGRDVLEKVSLLREIQCENPHRGHLDILAQLSLAERFNWIKGEKKKDRNFDGLLAAWLDELDAEALNRGFYEKLLGWFKRVVDKGGATFPSPKDKPVPPARHAIRMISRILFIWFLKEKRLVDGGLFEKETAKRLLKPGADDSYYRAILQNLFFATLNTPIEERAFRKDGDNHNQYDNEYRVFNLYRYADLIADKKEFERLMARTPFVNGGLFDCLDYFVPEKNGKGRVDCFTDNPSHRKLLRVPDALFFDGDSKNPKKSPGLFSILRKYKFTVEENTPVEQEVALDPELLGNVFEKLLGFLNRDEVGAHYTPRPIVDYMTRESLARYFAAGMTSPEDENDGDLQDRLRMLLSSDTDYEILPLPQKLREDEIAKFVELAGELRLLDPAVGSGAFPMGALALLTMAFNRIDPDNSVLCKREMANAQKFETKSLRDDAVELVRQMFSKKNHLNYGRKLSLIRDNLFGVDILPEAVQICRLRFFISLAIEQQANDDPEDNFGIRPLPNLETRMLATDSLRKIAPAGLFRGVPKIKKLEEELKEIRRNFFNASDRKTKQQCSKADEKKREELADALRDHKYPSDDADRIVAWDLYDQNAVADWFDPEWMFSVSDFHVVIGNPPYIQLEANRGRLANLYSPENYAVFTGKSDIYCLFYERGLGLLSAGGHLAYISSNKFMRTNYGKKLRGLLMKQATLRTVIDFGENPVFEAGVDPAILLMKNALPPKDSKFTAATIKKAEDIFQLDSAIANLGFEMLQTDLSESEWALIPPDVLAVIKKMRRAGTPMKIYVRKRMHYGVKTGRDEAFVIDAETRRRLIAEAPNSAELIKLYLLGGEIKKWRINKPEQYVIFTLQDTDINSYPAVKKHLAQYYDSLVRRATPSAEYWYALQSPGVFYDYRGEPKIVYNETSKEIHSFIDHSGLYVNKTAFVVFAEDKEYLLGILNSEMMDFYYRHTFPCWGDPWNRGRIQFQGIRMAAVPIVPADKPQRQKIARLVSEILESPQSPSVPQLEADINALVYEIYGLTKPEIALIKEWQAIRHEAEQQPH